MLWASLLYLAYIYIKFIGLILLLLQRKFLVIALNTIMILNVNSSLVIII